MLYKNNLAWKMASVGFVCVVVSEPTIAEVKAASYSAWTCSNQDTEIACDTSGCEVAETFTPMSVSLDTGSLSVCAYSGCWQGPPSSVHLASDRFHTFTAKALPFSTAPASVADIAITVDLHSGVATLIVADVFAHPMHCEKAIK